MQWFHHMKVRSKLILGFSVMVLIMGAVGLAGYLSSTTINRGLVEIFDVRLPSLNYLLQTDRDLQQLLVAERSMVFANSKSEEFTRLVEAYEENLKQSLERWDKYKQLPASSEAMALFPLYEASRAEWMAVSSQIVEGRKADTRAGRRLALDLSLGQAQDKFEAMRGYLDQLQEVNLRSAQEAAQKADSTYKKATSAVLGILGLGLVLGILFIWATTRSIVGPIKQVLGFLGKMGKGDLGETLALKTPPNCSEILQCGQTQCQSYGRPAHCWVESGSFSGVPTCPKCVAGESCQNCQVFKKARINELEEMSSALNALTSELAMKAELAKSIAQNDLTREVRVASEKDTLGNALATMTANLNEIMGRINQTVVQVASGSGQVAESSQALSQGATEQAASIEEITSSMTELSSQTQTNSENADLAKDMSTSALEAAHQGNDQMTHLIGAMKDISLASREIAKIIKAIDDIAFQTNLLALNAAVEAARAGKHGKGFAVVAQEVRGLAGRSATAARETAELIEGTMKKVENGTGIVNLTAESFSGIVERTSKVKDLVVEIAAASQEQALGISQVNQGLHQIEQVTQQNTANAEETASAAEQLSGMSDELRRIVSRFRVKKAGIPVSGHALTAVSPPLKGIVNQDKTDGWDSLEKKDARHGASNHRIDPSQVIDLDDPDFGRY